MSTTIPLLARPAPRWLAVVALLGLGWNLFGVYQFIVSSGGTLESLTKQGMTLEQAQLYLGLPLWMSVSFAIGVFGGVAGCLLLWRRRRIAVPVLALSLVSCLVLYAGDVALGVFAVFGAPQVIILTTVVAIAAALLLVARWARRHDYLV